MIPEEQMTDFKRHAIAKQPQSLAELLDEMIT